MWPNLRLVRIWWSVIPISAAIVCAATSLALWAACQCAPRTDNSPDRIVSRDRSVEPQEFEIARDGDLVLVPVSIDGLVFQFVVDTGSTVGVFDSKLRRYFAPTGRFIRLNGNSRHDLFEVCDEATAF